MFNLDHAIAAWRRSLSHNAAFLPDDCAELEQHLRDQIAGLMARGYTAESAFQESIREMGDYAHAEAEYNKVYWGKLQRRGNLIHAFHTTTAMLRNYALIALRTLKKHPGYSFINVFGLALGIACFALLALYVTDELTFDRFHTNHDRIYRIVETRQSANGTMQGSSTATGFAPFVSDQVPEVEEAVRIFSLWRVNLRHEDYHFYEGNYLFADAGFFEVFDFDWLAGDPATALDEPASVILTADAAIRYFGSTEVIGQTLNSDIRGFGSDVPLRVTGVLREMPSNSHLNVALIVPSSTLNAAEWWPDANVDWGNTIATTYLKLVPDANAAQVEAKLNTLTRPHLDPEQEDTRTVSLQALTDIHFGSAAISADAFNANKGNQAYAYIFSAIALFILLIAGINYVNLATARAAQRAREVGLRKVVGAHRKQVAGQFLGESVLMALIAGLIGGGLAMALLPAFNTLTGKTLSLLPLGMTTLTLAAVVLLLGLAAGVYPALMLSRFAPAAVLKGGHTGGRSGARLRRVLVVAQFSLSILMIIATLVVYRQLDYTQTKSLGYEPEQLISVDINSWHVRQSFQTLKTEFARHPAVEGVSVSSRLPGDWKGLASIDLGTSGTANDGLIESYLIGADASFLDVYQMRLLNGSNFRSDEGDSTAVLINETAVAQLGLTDPIGASLRIPRGDGDYAVHVIGVVEDFHVRSLHETITPVVLAPWNNPVQSIDYFTIRAQTDDLPGLIAHLDAAHAAIDPGTLLEHNLLDQRLTQFYANEQQVGRVFGIAAGLAIVIACLGLFGLAAFVAEQRTKEIGVRKVLGASLGSLVQLLSLDFLKLVGVSLVIAAPLAYWIMNQWLDGFAYHINVTLGVVLLAGVVALAIALLTVCYQAIKTARTNPVEALRQA
ncbi:MAG: ABC transporter permease [Rhodothermales bacterium]